METQSMRRCHGNAQTRPDPWPDPRCIELAGPKTLVAYNPQVLYTSELREALV